MVWFIAGRLGTLERRVGHQPADRLTEGKENAPLIVLSIENLTAPMTGNCRPDMRDAAASPGRLPRPEEAWLIAAAAYDTNPRPHGFPANP
jgi:hypothetical protein